MISLQFVSIIENHAILVLFLHWLFSLLTLQTVASAYASEKYLMFLAQKPVIDRNNEQ